MCVFSSCSFCPIDTAGSLHSAFSDGIGESLIEIKLKTQDDHVRTCVSELEGAGDASALEKYYHEDNFTKIAAILNFHVNMPPSWILCVFGPFFNKIIAPLRVHHCTIYVIYSDVAYTVEETVY